MSYVPPPYAYSPYGQHQEQPSNPQNHSQYGTYGSSGNANSPAGQLAATTGAFEHNANRIPGLNFGASSSGPAPSTSTSPVGWNAANAFIPPATSHVSLQLNQSVQNHMPPRPQPPTISKEDSFEEGELSEEGFEDLYEPTDFSNPTNQPLPVAARQLSIGYDRATSAVDVDGSSIYGSGSPAREPAPDSVSASRAQGEVTSSDEYWEPFPVERERSGSYSPYLSPREVRQEAVITKLAPQEIRDIQEPQNNLNKLAPPTQPPSVLQPTAKAQNNSISSDPPVSEGNIIKAPSAIQRVANNQAFTSLKQAKIKAKDAVHQLWKHNVRYKTFVDEGFDPVLIKEIFTDLGLDSTLLPAPEKPLATGTNVGIKESSDVVNLASQQKPKTIPTKATQALSPHETTSTTTQSKPKEVPKMSAAEERKDKIARKLAAKNRKSGQAAEQVMRPAAVSTSVNSDQQVDTPKSTPTTQSKMRSKAETNSILRERLAALKKQQEEAENKKAAATAAAATAKETESSAAVDDANNFLDSLSQPSANKPITDLGENLAVNSRPAFVQLQASKDVYGLPNAGVEPKSAPLTPQLASSNVKSLKRPVAADFDAHPRFPEISKRPRRQDTLILDVSDDDEDVEMDIGSPVDVAASILRGQTPNGRTLANFPSLSDSLTWRQRSSPATPVASTPPEGGTKLTYLQKKIEETKRLIAEAEAKKNAKKVSDAQSPTGATPLAQTPPETTSLKLPKTSEIVKNGSSLVSQRRERIASVQLPAVEASLKEKQEKLKRLLAEASQLQIEVEAELAEKQKLFVEMDELGKQAEAQQASQDVFSEIDEADAVSHSLPLTNSDLDGQQTTQIPISPMQQSTFLDQVTTQPSLGPSQPTPTEKSLLPEMPNVNGIDPKEGGGEKQLSPVARDNNRPRPELDWSNSGGEAMDLDQHLDQTGTTVPPSAPMSITERNDRQRAFTAIEVQGQISVITSSPSSNGQDGSEKIPANIPLESSASPAVEESKQCEPTTTQISNANIVPLSDAEGEAPDDDPYEPSPAQAPTADVSRAAEAKNDEVPTRPAFEDKDLMTYTSPLSYFRAYRFHPQYFEKVSQGLRSLTYNAHIDPMKQLCPYECVGEACKDGTECQYQHFDTMALPDNEIIMQIGSAETFEGDKKTQFIDGLRKLLSDLKVKKIRDFEPITKAILQYRADFRDDISKILPLEGVTL